MCGFRIEIAVCSRVGHIFRRVRPYSSPTGEDTMTKNTLRMVNVWLDDYKVRTIVVTLTYSCVTVYLK